MIHKYFLTGLALSFLSACLKAYSSQVQLDPGYQLPPSASFVVAAIRDPQETGQEPAAGTGRQMQLQLVQSLMEMRAKANPSQSEDVRAACQDARRFGATHVLKATFSHWEDNATQWSGSPDRVTFLVEIYAVEDQRLLGVVTEERKGEAMTLSNEPTSRFLRELAEQSVMAILR